MRIHGLLTGVGLCALSVVSARAEVVEVAAEADIQAAINGAAAEDASASAADDSTKEDDEDVAPKGFADEE